MIWTAITIFGLVAAIWIRWRHKNQHLLAVASKIPGPPALPGLGNALLFMCQPEEFIRVIRRQISEYGDVWGLWLGPDYSVVVTDPDDLKILLSNPNTSFKGPLYDYMADIIGGGILSGSGPAWRKHRKIATPNYGKRYIESYTGVFNNEVELLLQKYRKKTGQYFDIYDYIVQTTSYCVCRTLMGLTKDQTMNLPHIQDIIEGTPKIYDVVFDRITKWYLQIYPVFRLSKYYEVQKDFTFKTKIFSTIILQHRKEHLKTLEVDNKIDLLNSEENLENTQLSVIDRFILSKEIDGEELLYETFTIFTSSQEASAKITSFILLMMAFHPECQVVSKLNEPLSRDEVVTAIRQQQNKRAVGIDLKPGELLKYGSEQLHTLDWELFVCKWEEERVPDKLINKFKQHHIHCSDPKDKLYKEIKTVIGNEDRPITNDDLKRMPYLDMVFKEVLRLFPIGAILQRSIHEDIALSNSTIPAGSAVVIPIFHLHRDPRFWNNPDDFDPDRFSPKNTKTRHPYCYIPFSLGPMDCLGRYFGTKLIKTICVRVLREFEITTTQSYKDLKLAISISTVAIDGYPAKLTPRSQ